MAASATTSPTFDRYQIILDRKPFGDPPPAPAQPPPPQIVNPAQSFARTIRMSTIYEIDGGGIRVGFVNKQDNDSFMLDIGEAHNGIELVSASYEEEEAVLRRGTEMAILKLADDNIQLTTPQQVQERQTSYEQRRRARREQMEQRRAQPPPEPTLTGEALERHLRDYQMEVIRSGMPPLPIPLTPEMDRQLVEEGVLPP